MQYLNEKDISYIENLAVKACEAITEVYNSDFNVNYKDDKSPLTEADKRANKIITQGLSERFPNFSILSEESSDDLSRLTNDYCFIVDPLDGTKEFVKRNGEFTVNIALSYCGKSVFGIIAVPCTGEIYTAQKGMGAKYKLNGETYHLKVSDKTKELCMVASRSHPSETLQKAMDINKDKITNVIGVGSSLKGCMVARAKADIYYRFGPTMEWDTAAMQCIVEEAGGIFKNMDDSEMTYNRKDSLNSKGFYILNDIRNKLILP